MAVYRKIGNKAGEADALNSLGQVSLATGQAGEARAQHHTALTLASKIGGKYEQARAHDGIARTHHTAGDTELAVHHWKQAHTLFDSLGVPDAEKVRAWFTAIKTKAV